MPVAVARALKMRWPLNRREPISKSHTSVSCLFFLYSTTTQNILRKRNALERSPHILFTGVYCVCAPCVCFSTAPRAAGTVCVYEISSWHLPKKPFKRRVRIKNMIIFKRASHNSPSQWCWDALMKKFYNRFSALSLTHSLHQRVLYVCAMIKR